LSQAFCVDPPPPAKNNHDGSSAGHVTERAAMMSNILRSGLAALEHEIAQERAGALGRLGRRLESALAALAACPPTANPDRIIRDRLVAQAGYALWLYVVQREASGLSVTEQTMRDYAVPREVYARMGPIADGVEDASAPTLANARFVTPS
jgi:hypothetical protein